jgi:hypothetical protein
LLPITEGSLVVVTATSQASMNQNFASWVFSPIEYNEDRPVRTFAEGLTLEVFLITVLY